MPITLVSRRLRPFDTLLFLGNASVLFGGPAWARRSLKRFAALSNDGARIIAWSLDPYRPTDPDHLEHHQRNRARDRAAGHVRMRIRLRKHVGPWFDYALVSREEVQDPFSSTGRQVERFLDSHTRIYTAVMAQRAQCGDHTIGSAERER